MNRAEGTEDRRSITKVTPAGVHRPRLRRASKTHYFNAPFFSVKYDISRIVPVPGNAEVGLRSGNPQSLSIFLRAVMLKILERFLDAGLPT